MNYLYTINLYKKGNKIHSEQLLSENNYKLLDNLLVGDDDIHPGEYIVDNGKMLMAVIDMILMENTVKMNHKQLLLKIVMVIQLSNYIIIY